MFFKPIRDLSKKLSKAEDKLPAATKKALEANAMQLEEYNKDQLNSGEDSEGNKLPDYSPNSVKNFGKRPGPMTLRDTGSFQDKIKPDFSKEAFNMESSDPKAGMLTEKYGDAIEGINKTNLDELGQDIAPQIVYELKKSLKL